MRACPKTKPIDTLAKMLTDDGITDLRTVGEHLCGIDRFKFTTGLLVDLGAAGYARRYCYEHEAEAREALRAWDGEGHPGGPWIKCKGAGFDLLNPALH